MTQQLAERTCSKCGATDTEPMHVQYVALNHPVTGAAADLSITKHVQCCAEDGCPICGADMERATAEGADISQMRDFLQHRPPDHQQKLFEQFSVESPDYQIPMTSDQEA
jgi:hypothetical protein